MEKIKKFNFKVKSHTDLGIKNNRIDFETSTKLSGSRFVVLKENIALLRESINKFYVRYTYK